MQARNWNSMPRYKLTIEYDGTGLVGWQRQDEGVSVQSLLQAAIYKFCGEEVDIVGAGRTDAGVHALGQVAHMDLVQSQDPFTIVQAVNFHLMPARVTVLNVEKTHDDFHARFSATSRSYLYRIINRRARLALAEGYAWHVPVKLNETAMRQAAKLLLGNQDFSSFRDSQCQAKSPLKTLDALTVERKDEEIRITVSARSFLHHQVRIMVGTLKMVGAEKWAPEEISRILEARNRAESGPTAPAEGLYLVGVEY